MTYLLEIDRLQTVFRTGKEEVISVDEISFKLKAGETIGIVGESGCGKSVTSLSVMGLLGQNGRIKQGEIHFDGSNLAAWSESELRRLRGKDIAMIFQEPMSSLNPVLTIGNQLVEMIRQHTSHSRKEAKAYAVQMLRKVGLPRAEDVMEVYPHTLSGGMRQRIMIAMALSCKPKLLIADEPTTALDVTIQAQILELMKELREESGAAIMLITHDLGVVAEMADKVVVMYAGQIVEEADVFTLFREPQHPYTKGLLNSIPRLEGEGGRLTAIPGTVPSLQRMPAGCRFHTRCTLATERCQQHQPDLQAVGVEHLVRCWVAQEQAADQPTHSTSTGGRRMTTNTPLLQIDRLKTYYPIKKGVLSRTVGHVKAVDDVSLAIYEGETVGLVGESGCGKSTIGRSIVRLEDPFEGRILFQNEDITHISQRELKPIRTRLQIIFQDPYSSLNPRKRINDILAEPFIAHRLVDRQQVQGEVDRLLDLVGLPRAYKQRYPHEFSGGQRQRIGIARVISFQPKLVVCDEPVSALDVSIQAQILNLLADLQKELKLTYLFIAHGIGAVQYISTRVAVMYLGKIVEIGRKEEVFQRPKHPYTQILLNAYPAPDPTLRSNKRLIIQGDVPSPANPPAGCRFHTRCPYVQQLCRHEEPPLTAGEHAVACHFPIN
ncbi:glutathione ABC transporter ATP-binding protein [Paenibacillus ferrarius]|uniref:Glutathione ABC transporter ATP-binding protein n=1 Tax=Paenibacillus ferrarius TaxID=1469647 RepID=A0A1V4HKC4_9BACL|nr:glutathione ABC transporter ATP-binding protein [Paenibacillus ferrarius]